jgi:hypothetical protein
MRTTAGVLRRRTSYAGGGAAARAQVAAGRQSRADGPDEELHPEGPHEALKEELLPDTVPVGGMLPMATASSCCSSCVGCMV